MEKTFKIDNVKDNDERLPTLSARLVFALNTLGVTQADLSRRIGVKPQAIHYLCNSNSKKSSFTYEIADALKINSLWLACGNGEMLRERPSDISKNTTMIEKKNKIPVLNFKQMKQLANKNSTLTDLLPIIDEWISSDSNIKINDFSFKLNDKSMFPRFDQDTTIIIDPDIKPKNNDFVVVFLEEMDDVIFRMYEDCSGRVFFKPINSDLFKTIIKKNNDLILGVLVEARWRA